LKRGCQGGTNKGVHVVVKDVVGGLHERVVLRNAAAARATG
jgi:hypothetical protein